MITVILPTAGNMSGLIQTLHGLVSQSQAPKAVLVVSYGDSQISQLKVQLKAFEKQLPLKVLHYGGQNLSQARNAALLAVETELVWFLSDTVVPHPKALISHLQAHQEMAQAEDGLTVGHIGWNPARPCSSLMEHMLGEGGQLYDFTRLRHYYNTGYRYCYADNLVAKTALLQEVKFDPIMEGLLGDIELGYRLDLQKAQIFYVAAAVAYLAQDYTLTQAYEYQFQKGRAAFQLGRKHPILDYEEIKLNKYLNKHRQLTQAHLKLLQINLAKLEQLQESGLSGLVIEGKPIKRFVEQIIGAIYYSLLEHYYTMGIGAAFEEGQKVAIKAKNGAEYSSRLAAGKLNEVEIELGITLSLQVSAEERIIEQLEDKLKAASEMAVLEQHYSNLLKQREDEIRQLQRALKGRND